MSDVGYPTDGDGRSHETGRVTMFTLQLSLTRMESDLRGMRQDIQYMRESQMNRAAEMRQLINDHEDRIRKIEAKRYLEARSITTVAAVVLPIAAIGVSIIAIIVK